MVESNSSVPPPAGQGGGGGPSLQEFTLRSLLIGLVLCVVLGAANAYLGLKAGMTIAATYPAAVIGMAILRLFRGSILEENMARTVGSIGESVAAGAIFTIPAFYIAGIWKDFTIEYYWESAGIMVIGGIIGILFVTMLRRVMVEDKDLPFPESKAAAEIHRAGRTGGTGAKFLFGAMGAGALVQVLSKVNLFPASWEKFVTFSKSTVELKSLGAAQLKGGGGALIPTPDVSPAYIGVGYIIGPKLAALNFSGGLLAWGLFVPLLLYFMGDSVRGSLVAQGTADPDWLAVATAIWKFIVRPIAIGGMLVSAAFTLYRMRSSLIGGLKRSISDLKKSATAKKEEKRTEKDISLKYVLPALLVASAATFAIYYYFCHNVVAALVAAVVMVVAGFFFAAVSGYLVGMIGSSNNPISGLTLSTLIIAALLMVVLGMKGTDGVAAVLGVAAVICVAAAVAGEMLQDLKVGHLLGGTPYKMQVGDIIGVVCAAAVMFFPLLILHVGDIRSDAEKKLVKLEEQKVAVVAYKDDDGTLERRDYTVAEIRKLSPDKQNKLLGLNAGFGGKALPAPQAGLMALLSQGIVGGSMSWPLVVVGMIMAVGLILVQVRSPMLVCVGMYLPFGTTAAIFVGGMIRGLMDSIAKRRGFNEAQKIRSENNGVLISSGLIAGEALIGLVFAGLAFFDVQIPALIPKSSYVVSLAVFGLIALLLVWFPIRNAGSPDEPPPPSAVM